MKSNAGCNEFELSKAAKLQNVARAEENKTRKVKKTKRRKNGRGRYGNSYTKYIQKKNYFQGRLETVQSTM